MNKKMKKRKQAAAAAMQDNSMLLVRDKENQADGKPEADLAGDVSEQLDLFETWVIANGKYLLAGCILIVIGVAVFLTVQHLRTKAIEDASVRLADAVKIEQLEGVLKNVSASTPGYDLAQIRLARLYAADRKYDPAYAAYLAVAERRNDLFLSVRSRLDAAYIRELAGKPAEAAALFAAVADAADAMPDLRAEGAYGAGRLFLLLKNDSAAKKYLSQTDPEKAPTQTAAQWGMLSQALLNRMSSPAAAVPAKPAAQAPAKTKPAAK